MFPAGLDPFSLSIIVLALLCAIVAIAYGASELRLASHVLRSKPNSVLDASRGGPIELRGTVEPVGDALRAPISRTSCVAYEYEVEEYQSSGKHSSWNTIDSGEDAVPFRLDDGSGSVLIEPRGADLRLEIDDRLRVDGGTEPPEPIQRFIDRSEDVDDQNRTLDLRVIELRTGNDRRYVERRLDVGAEAHVLGTARYDTTVAERAGEVNAAVGGGEAATATSPWIRLRHRLFGYPFVISDQSERGLGLRALAKGTIVVLAATAGPAVFVAWTL